MPTANPNNKSVFGPVFVSFLSILFFDTQSEDDIFHYFTIIWENY